MKKIIILLFVSIYLLNANNIEISLENKSKKSSDYIFLESMNDSNSIKNNYESLSKKYNSFNLNISGNFNDMIGFNYEKTLNGNNFDSKEIYLGTSSMKYISYKKIKDDIKYSLRNTQKDISTFTLFNIVDISKEELSHKKLQTLDSTKNTLLNITGPKMIHRDYTLEKFRLTSEYMYDIAKEDSFKNSEYFIPFIFSKQINSNFRVYGTAILSLVQYNYTDISNYFIDGNNTKTNISYTNKFDQTSNDLILVKDEAPHVNLHLIGKYRGYEYGYKITASYDLKYYSLFLTSYYKATNLKNKHRLDDKGFISAERGNALVYNSLKFTQYYLSFGLNYKF